MKRLVSFWIIPPIARRYWIVISSLMIAGIGMAIVKQERRVMPFTLVMIVYPLVYYVTYVFPKYRHPIEPVIFVLAAYGLVSTARFAMLKLSIVASKE
jgi:hypothetical protein